MTQSQSYLIPSSGQFSVLNTTTLLYFLYCVLYGAIDVYKIQITCYPKYLQSHVYIKSNVT